METSPVPRNVEIAGVPAPAVAGGSSALVTECVEPNNTVIEIGTTMLYDSTTNPLVVSPLSKGSLVTVVNQRAVAVLVKSSNPADPGVLVGATSTVQLGFNPQGAGGGFVYFIGGGSSGSTGNATYAVDTLAAMPPIASVPNGTWIYVRSQKSWYWTATDPSGVPAYIRLITPNQAWMVQTAWGVDTVAGNDENLGTVASPLRTMTEFFARLPAINRDTTVTIAAGSAFGANDWIGGQMRVLAGAQATQPILTIQGTRTLGPNLVVTASSNEVGNAAPLIDVGAALTVGTLIQATSGASSGATAVVVALVAGTQYRTTPWMVGGFTRTVPPAPLDNIAAISLPTTPRVCESNINSLTIYADLDIGTTFQQSISATQLFRTCRVGGLMIGFQTLAYSFQGCAINVTAFQFQLSKTQLNGCGVVLTGAPNVLIEGGACVYLTDTVIQGPGTIAVRNNAVVEATSLGIFGATSFALQVIQGAMFRVRGTLYGSDNATGTVVKSAGHVTVEGAIVPTLASAGTELTLEASLQAIPPSSLSPGAAVPANWPANALTTWAEWAAPPFNRYVMSYGTGASIAGP